MKILLLEDNRSEAIAISEFLQDDGHSVFNAFQISDAISIFESEEIDFIIADLMVSPVGLKNSEINASQAGHISGWIWLKNYVFPLNENWKKKTIIYSGWSSILKKTDNKNIQGVPILRKSRTELKDISTKIQKMTNSNL